MKEIELLFKVNSDVASTLQSLKSLGDYSVVDILDVYYVHSAHDCLQFQGSTAPLAWLRVRNKGGVFYITYKKDVLKNCEWVYSDEYETKIEDGATVQKIFEELGYEELITVKNTRYVFTGDFFELVVEDVADLGLYLEIEYVGEDIDPFAARKLLEEFMTSLQLDISDELQQGKPELLYLKKHGLL